MCVLSFSRMTGRMLYRITCLFYLSQIRRANHDTETDHRRTMLQNNTPTFGATHFGRAPLRDQRRTNRLVQIADRCMEHPDGSLPNKLQDPAMYDAMDRLMRTPAVTHQSVLQTHREVTLEKMQQSRETLLVIHDGTELDFTSKESLKDQLGFVGGGTGHGYLCHNSLVVTAKTKEVLGLANQILHHRENAPEGETKAEKRVRENRESLLWLRASQTIGNAPLECLCVDVCDRDADTFEFLDYEHQANKFYLIRAQYNRAILTSHDDQGASSRLFDYLRCQEAVAGKVVYVQAQNDQKARYAKCLVSFAAVQIKAPNPASGIHGTKPLKVWAVRIWEIDAPADVKEPLKWILLTKVPVETAEDALERIEWYETRWMTEEYHKAQKTGCGIEKSQFKKAAHLEPMIALLSVVAVQLLQLRFASRDEARSQSSATEYVSSDHVSTLSIYRYQESRPLTVHEFYWALARLGGHSGRRTRPPGWQVLWRGWAKLQHMVDYERARRIAQGVGRAPPEM